MKIAALIKRKKRKMQDLVTQNPEAHLRTAHHSGAEVLLVGPHFFKKCFLITKVKSEEKIKILC